MLPCCSYKCSNIVHTYQQSLWSVTFWVLRCPLNAWRLNLGFGTQKCPFPLNRGVPLTEVVGQKIMWILILSSAKFCVPWTDRGVPKERFHFIIFYLSVQLRTNTYKTEVLFIFILIKLIANWWAWELVP